MQAKNLRVTMQMQQRKTTAQLGNIKIKEVKKKLSQQPRQGRAGYEIICFLNRGPDFKMIEVKGKVDHLKNRIFTDHSYLSNFKALLTLLEKDEALTTIL